MMKSPSTVRSTMDNDTPELIDIVKTSEEVLLTDLQELIQDNSRRLSSKVDAKGNPLTDTQVENLKAVIEAQMLRLAQMRDKYEKRKVKRRS